VKDDDVRRGRAAIPVSPVLARRRSFKPVCRAVRRSQSPNMTRPAVLQLPIAFPFAPIGVLLLRFPAG